MTCERRCEAPSCGGNYARIMRFSASLETPRANGRADRVRLQGVAPRGRACSLLEANLVRAAGSLVPNLHRAASWWYSPKSGLFATHVRSLTAPITIGRTKLMLGGLGKFYLKSPGG